MFYQAACHHNAVCAPKLLVIDGPTDLRACLLHFRSHDTVTSGFIEVASMSR